MLNIPNKVPGDTHFSYEFNSYVDELENSVTDINTALNGADSHQVGQSMSVYGAAGNYFVDSGIANALNLISSQYNFQVPKQYYDGMLVRCLPAFTNTGPATMNVAGIGNLNIKLSDGVTDIAPGDIIAGVMAQFYYSLANTCMVFIGNLSYSSQIFPGVMLDFGGFTAPFGYLFCDGTAYSRSAYPALLTAITQTQSGTSSSGMNTISGLTSTAQMYVGMPLESGNFTPGTTVASIVDANNITASTNAASSGPTPIQFFNWGNGDGLTTFNVPNLTRSTTIGAGGISSGTPFGVPGIVVGQSGGEEAHTQLVAELATHNHTAQIAFSTFGASGSSERVIEGDTTTDNTGSSTPFNVMQPSVITYKIIKI